MMSPSKEMGKDIPKLLKGNFFFVTHMSASVCPLYTQILSLFQFGSLNPFEHSSLSTFKLEKEGKKDSLSFPTILLESYFFRLRCPPFFITLSLSSFMQMKKDWYRIHLWGNFQISFSSGFSMFYSFRSFN